MIFLCVCVCVCARACVFDITFSLPMYLSLDPQVVSMSCKACALKICEGRENAEHLRQRKSDRTSLYTVRHISSGEAKRESGGNIGTSLSCRGLCFHCRGMKHKYWTQPTWGSRNYPKDWRDYLRDSRWAEPTDK